ncbi:TPR-containing protein DDB_G0280363-like isoform X1 [Drosophila virilis]|uniref:TPR-containing protein DDB_G0280363-like isoform X1 n=1 Tax=Drosophila virilis TaxID=7244 RepID=UPI00139653AE|nr:mediator of RNA polymerase II transcription subunit 15-like isoform X2 [Drosophila virilis]
MEACRLKKADIKRMWSQIVTQTGIDKYTYAEWQENYEEFWKCMLSTSEPYIRIQSIEQLTRAHVNQMQLPIAKSNPPAKPQPAKQQPVKVASMSDSISMLRIPRLKPGQQPTNSISDSLGSVKNTQPDWKPGQENIPQQHQHQQQPQQQHPVPQKTSRLAQEQRQYIPVQQPKQVLQQQPPTQQDKQGVEKNPLQQSQNVPQAEEEQEQQHFQQQRKSQPHWPGSYQTMEQTQQPQSKDQLQQQFPLPHKILEQQIKTYPRPCQDRSRPYQRQPPNRSKSNQPIMNERLQTQTNELQGVPHSSAQVVYERQREMLFKPLAEQVKTINKINESRVKIESGNDCELENKLIADALKLANKVGKADNIAKVNKISPEIASSNGEKIYDWLQSFDDKASKAIDHKITDTADFFKNLPNLSTVIGKTPHELKVAIQNVIICEGMEDDKPSIERQRPQANKKEIQSNYLNVSNSIAIPLQFELNSNKCKKQENNLKQFA